MLTHWDPFQDNGSIKCSLVTTAQFGREEAGRYLCLHTTIRMNKANLCVHATVVVNEARLPDLCVKKLSRERLVPMHASQRCMADVRNDRK